MRPGARNTTITFGVQYVGALTFSLLGLSPVAASAAGAGRAWTPAAKQVRVRFTYGPEKRLLIQDVTGAFNLRWEKTASGRAFCVQAIPMGSSDNVNLINHEYTQEKGAELLRV